MGLSNHLISILNFLTALISIPILGVGIWLATKHNTDCVRFLQWPIIIIGLVLLLVSIAGFVGSCCRITWLLWVYLAVVFILIVLLFCFTIFSFVVTHKGAGELVSGKGYKEYRLGDYSSWLQKRVEKASTWEKIRSCLADSKVCTGIDTKYDNLDAFSRANLSPLMSGCCKPPTACNFTYVTATNWTSLANPGADTDCTTWNNDPSELCFECNSCKAGVLQNIKSDWRKAAIVEIVTLVFLIIVYSVGCCAIRNVRRSNKDGLFF